MNLIEAERLLKGAGYGLIKESRANDFAGRVIANGLVEEIKDRIAELGLKGTVSIDEIEPEAGICISVGINGRKPFSMWLSKEDKAAEFADANYDVLCMAETYKVGLPADEAVKKAGEIFANIASSEDLGESTKMGLKEARKILEANGCRLLKEYNGAMSILIRTAKKVLDDNYVTGTVEEIELNTKLKPLGAMIVTVEGAEKPYIIGYAENPGTTELGDYIVFTCENRESTRVRPVMRNCYSRAETYNCIIEKIKDYVQKYILESYKGNKGRMMNEGPEDSFDQFKLAVEIAMDDDKALTEYSDFYDDSILNARKAEIDGYIQKYWDNEYWPHKTVADNIDCCVEYVKRKVLD